MQGKQMIEYTFKFSGILTVDVEGVDHEEAYDRAEKELEERYGIDPEWIDDVDSESYTDYEEV